MLRFRYAKNSPKLAKLSGAHEWVRKSHHRTYRVLHLEHSHESHKKAQLWRWPSGVSPCISIRPAKSRHWTEAAWIKWTNDFGPELGTPTKPVRSPNAPANLEGTAFASALWGGGRGTEITPKAIAWWKELCQEVKALDKLALYGPGGKSPRRSTKRSTEKTRPGIGASSKIPTGSVGKRLSPHKP